MAPSNRPQFPKLPPAPATGDSGLDELNQLLGLLDEHDERGLVLALAAFAEDTLGRLLIGYLREPKQAKELVEGFNAPLGTFSARIKAAFALGLLKREQFDDLEILRRVRNEFAHSWQGVAFQRNDIKAHIGRLYGQTFDNNPPQGDEKARLRSALSWILVELRLQLKHNHADKVKAPSVAFRLKTSEAVRPQLVEITDDDQEPPAAPPPNG